MTSYLYRGTALCVTVSALAMFALLRPADPTDQPTATDTPATAAVQTPAPDAVPPQPPTQADAQTESAMPQLEMRAAAPAPDTATPEVTKQAQPLDMPAMVYATDIDQSQFDPDLLNEILAQLDTQPPAPDVSPDLDPDPDGQDATSRDGVRAPRIALSNINRDRLDDLVAAGQIYLWATDVDGTSYVYFPHLKTVERMADARIALGQRQRVVPTTSGLIDRSAFDVAVFTTFGPKTMHQYGYRLSAQLDGEVFRAHNAFLSRFSDPQVVSNITGCLTAEGQFIVERVTFDDGRQDQVAAAPCT